MNTKRPPLHAICPYFAMFPEEFVREQVETYTKKGELVFDPFCGRGTTILESLLNGRDAAGSDINPVAYCISRAKAERPKLNNILLRLNDLEVQYKNTPSEIIEKERIMLPIFFQRAFYHTTLRELIFLRKTLNWRMNKIDRFICALTIGSLHGEMDRSSAYFSNQMPRTICLKPNYSIKYWKRNNLFPKKKHVFDMLREKSAYRLKNIDNCSTGEVKLADARNAYKHFNKLSKKVSLVVTSPPYFNITRYEEDQWLRLWFLGGPPHPTYGKISKDDRHEALNKYWQFLKESWAGISPLLKESAKIVIRLGAIGIDADEMTDQIKKSIQSVFTGAKFAVKPKCTEIKRRQAQSFVPKSKGCLFEIDYVFSIQKL